MDYKQFIGKITDGKIVINETYSNYVNVNAELFYSYKESERKKFGAKPTLKFDFILEAWETGGIRGGSYHEDSQNET